MLYRFDEAQIFYHKLNARGTLKFYIFSNNFHLNILLSLHKKSFPVYLHSGTNYVIVPGDTPILKIEFYLKIFLVGFHLFFSSNPVIKPVVFSHNASFQKRLKMFRKAAVV